MIKKSVTDSQNMPADLKQRIATTAGNSLIEKQSGGLETDIRDAEFARRAAELVRQMAEEARRVAEEGRAAADADRAGISAQLRQALEELETAKAQIQALHDELHGK